MNLYFLVEGTTESVFYPEFIAYYCQGKLNRVSAYSEAASQHYYLVSCDGYPHIFTGSQKADNDVTALKSAIMEVNDNPVYDHLVLCLDSDETSIEERLQVFEKYVEKYKKEGVVLNKDCSFRVVIQHRCLETWFLGNKRICATNPNDSTLVAYKRYYDVKGNDPELMGNYRPEYTHQDFHLQYLRAMLREKKKTYRKEFLSDTIAEANYLQQLEKRAKGKEQHIQSFAGLLRFFDAVNEKLL